MIKVCVSDADCVDANGVYECKGFHNIKPAYRRIGCGDIFWICWSETDWILLKQKRPPEQKRHTFLYRCKPRSCNGESTDDRLPVGQWLHVDIDHEYCNVAYEYAGKAR